MKVAWIDCETTGLDSKKNGIIQLAIIIEIDHQVVSRKEFFMNPVGKEVTEEALGMNGFTKSMLESYPPYLSQKPIIEEFFANFVQKYDKNDKFIAAGYNVKFDMDFLASLWEDANDRYFYSWFEHVPLDIYQAHVLLEWAGLAEKPCNRKLESLAHLYGITITTHDAASDIEATRQIAEIIRAKLGKGVEI